jgi:DNA-binding transcriptional LysR family regulator
MNLRQLTYIVTIAETKNISHAAEKLFLSRPALNHYLISLEEEIGTLLFKRIKRKMLPTFAGDTYINAAKKILDIQKQTYKTFRDIIDSKTGCLSVGITSGQGTILFNKLFPLFHKKYPEFTVNLLEGNVSVLENAMIDGRIDLAVIGLGSASSLLRHIVLQKTEILLVLPKNHPLAYLAAAKGRHYNTIDLKLLKNDRFILRTTDTKSREIIDRYFEKNGFSPKVIMECRLGQMAYNMVKNGIGVTFLHENEFVPGDGLSCFSLSPKEFWSTSIAYREGTRFTKAEEYFIKLFQDYYQKNSTRGNISD